MSKLHYGTFRKPQINYGENGSMTLVLPEIAEDSLPQVSIITITKDRAQFVGIMLYNWLNIKYPRKKLEWIILDDSESTERILSDYIPQDDPLIKYVKLDKWLPVAEKRNEAVKLASGEIIVHMDDDDYYFSDSVLAKVRLILHYDVCGVHSIPLGVYDMMEETSFLFDPKSKNGQERNDVAEATLAYKKSYWEAHKFGSTVKNGTGEGASFIGKRFNKWMNIPFWFNMISITHTQNITGHSRRFVNENRDTIKTGDFRQVFPADFKYILGSIHKLLKAEYSQPQTVATKMI